MGNRNGADLSQTHQDRVIHMPTVRCERPKTHLFRGAGASCSTTRLPFSASMGVSGNLIRCSRIPRNRFGLLGVHGFAAMGLAEI